MEELILISYLNDFIYCPISIYFHRLYGNRDTMLYHTKAQIDGLAAHSSIDTGQYTTSKNILQGIEVYSEKYGIIGKIDMYDKHKKILTEKKKHIEIIYDGYIFQLYAQYFAMTEMGYEIEEIRLYSIDTNKVYKVKLPKDDPIMYSKFEELLKNIRTFDVHKFKQTNIEKCSKCIYEPSCDRSMLC